MADPKKILVVDDEEGIREILTSHLKRHGYRVECAVDGLDALEKAAQFVPHIILLDVIMPKLDGWQTLTQLRKDENTSRIPVAMLTAKGETDSIMRSQEARVVEYFIKPFDLDEVAKFLKKFLSIPEEMS